MMSIIKWIFFDIGSTLVDESVAYKNRIERTISNTDVSYDEFYREWSRFQNTIKMDTIRHLNITD